MRCRAWTASQLPMFPAATFLLASLARQRFKSGWSLPSALLVVTMCRRRIVSHNKEQRQESVVYMRGGVADYKGICETLYNPV
eukprot:9471627-Pyramimonas_sp.AAC.1